MSDYLWDKTGEPEEDLERLEELLGEFRHRPRALELPPEATGLDAAPTHAARPPRAPRILRPAWLAVAAALLLAFTAGALFVLRRGAGEGVARREPAQAASQKSPGETREQSTQRTPSPVVESGNGGATPGANESARRVEQSVPDARDGQTGEGDRAVKDDAALKDERAAGKSLPRSPGRRQGVEVALKPRGVAGSGRDGRVESVGAGTPGVVAESAALTEGRAEKAQTLEERQRMAKDELMYVLRLTGLKLKEVQRKTQKVDAPKSTFDEQKPIR